MRTSRKWIALLLAGIMISSQVANTLATNVSGGDNSFYQSVTGGDNQEEDKPQDTMGDSMGDVSGDDPSEGDHSVSDGNGEEERGVIPFLAKFFSDLLGRNTKSTQSENTSLTGSKYSYSMDKSERPEFLDIWKLTVRNQEDGYVPGTQKAGSIYFNFQLYVSDIFMEEKLTEFQEDPSFPVPTGDIEASSKAVDDWLRATHLKELEFTYSFPKEIVCGSLVELNKEYILKTNQDGEVIGRYTIMESGDKGNLEMKVSLEAILFNRYGTELYFGFLMEVDGTNITGDDPVEGKFQNGNIIFDKAAGVDGGDSGAEVPKKYRVEKTAPVKVDTPYIDYVIEVEGTKGTGTGKKSLGGTQLVDTLPVLGADHLELQSLSYEYKDSQGETVKVDGVQGTDYTINSGKLCLKFPKNEMEDVFQASVSLRLALSKSQYEDSVKNNVGITADFTNSAVLEDENKKELSLPSQAETKMQWTFLSKTGTQGSVNGRYFDWKIELNTKFNHAGYAYLIDTINEEIHQYMFSPKNPLTITVDRGKEEGRKVLSFPEVADKTAEINALIQGGTLSGDFKYEQYLKGDSFAGVLAYLTAVGEITSSVPFYYTYQDIIGGTPRLKSLMVIPVKVIETPGGSGVTETNFVDLTNSSLTVQYTTQLNLDKWQGNMNAYLQDPSRPVDQAQNEAKFVYDKYYYGSGIGNDIDIDEVSLSRGLNVAAVYVEKSGVKYEPKTQKIRWKFQVNRVGGELLGTSIADDLADQGMELENISYRIIRIGEQTAGPAYDMNQGADQPKPNYTYNEGKVNITLDGMDSDTSYEIWLDAKVTDQTKLKQTGSISLSNSAGAETIQQDGTRFPAGISSSIPIQNQWIEKKAIGEYDYSDKSFTWQITVNPNFLTLNNAVITDFLPQLDSAGNQYPFTFKELKEVEEITLGSQGQETSRKGTVNGSSFICESNTITVTEKNGRKECDFTFQNPVTKKYIFTFTTDISPADLESWMKGCQDGFVETVNNKVQLTGQVADHNDQNPADITSVENGVEVHYSAAAAANKLPAGILDKTGTFNSDEGTISWKIVLNKQGIDLAGMTIVEDLTAAIGSAPLTHELLEDTIKVYQGTVDNSGKVSFNEDNLITGQITKRILNATQADEDNQKNGMFKGTSYGFEFTIQSGDGFSASPLVITFDTLITGNKEKPSSLRNYIWMKDGGDHFQNSEEADGKSDQEVELWKYSQTFKRPILQVYKHSVNSESLALPGAVFELYEVTGSSGSYSVNQDSSKKGKTLDNGYVYFMNLKENVIYQIKETSAPAGYSTAAAQYVVFQTKSDNTVYGDSITAGGVTGTLTVIKQQADGVYKYPLADKSWISFADETVLNSSVNEVKFTKQDPSGSPLEDCVFKLQRLKPDGSVDESWGPVQTDGKRYMSALSNASGEVIFNNVDKGDYLITETGADPQWQVGGKMILAVDCRLVNSNYVYDYTLALHQNENKLGPVSGSPGSYVVENKYITGTVKLMKTDAVAGKAGNLKGAEFKIYTKKAYDDYRTAHAGSDAGIGGDTSVVPIASASSNDKGIVAFQAGVLEYGKEYWIVETKSPKGYQQVTDQAVEVTASDYMDTAICKVKPNESFTISYAAAAPFNKANVTNKRRLGTVSFTKKNNNNQALSGRKFILSCIEPELNEVTGNAYFKLAAAGGKWNYTGSDAPVTENGETIWGYYQLASSGADGLVSFTDVPYGNYKVIELPATSNLILPAASVDNYDILGVKWTITMSSLGASYVESGNDSFQCKGGRNGSDICANVLKTVDMVVKRVSWDTNDTNFNGDYVKDIVYTLTGTDYEGKPITVTGTSDEDGKITLKDIPVLLPGSKYIVTESFINNKPTGFDTDTKYDVTVGLNPLGEAEVTSMEKSTATPDGEGQVNQDRDPDTGNKIDNNFTIQSKPYLGSFTLGKTASLIQPPDQNLTGIKDKPLSGVTFHLYTVDQNNVRTKIKTAASTGNNAAGSGVQNITFEDIVYGNKYLVTEEVPIGFQGKNTDNVIVNGDGSTEVTVMTLTPQAHGVNGWSFDDAAKTFSYTQQANIINTVILKSLKITKMDQEGNPLTGRKFNIYRRSANGISPDAAQMAIYEGNSIITYHPYVPFQLSGNAAGQGITAADGILSLEGLPYGDYLLIEELAEDVQPGSLCEVLVQVRAEGIKVFENESTGTSHANHIYSITQPLQPDVWKEVAVQGPIGGFYTCKVTNRIKFGYLDLKKETAELRADGTIEKTEFARPLARVQFQIFTADKNGDVYTKNSAAPYLTLETNDLGIFQYINDAAGQDYGAYGDVNGIDKKRLLCGHYILVESRGGAGYAPDLTERGFTILPDVPNETKVNVTTNIAAAPAGAVTENIIGNAALRSEVTLFKKDKDAFINGAQKDAVFEVWTTGTDDKLVGTLRYENRQGEDTKGYCYVLSDLNSDMSRHLKETDANGDLILYGDTAQWKLLPGEYSVKEVLPPDGYEVRDEFKFKIELGTVNGVPKASVTSANGNAQVNLESDGSITLTQDAINIKIAKQDELGNGLTGSLFTVTGRFSGRQPQDAPITLTLEEANKGRFIAGETYELKESKAPDGYKAAAESVLFSVNIHGEVELGDNPPGFAWEDTSAKDTIAFVNDPVELGIQKTDMESKPIDAIYGTAEFEITGVFADGQTKLLVTADGVLSDVLKGKLIGNNTYSIKEVTIPEGYQKAAEFTFTVQGDGSVEVNGIGTEAATYLSDTGLLRIKNAPVLITILKQGSDAEGNTVPLKGAEFKLEPRESTTFAGGSTKALSFTTAVDGKLAIEGVCKAGGIYLLTESKGPAGYQTPDGGTFLFKVREDGSGITVLANGLTQKAQWEDQTHTLTVRNDFTRFSLSKRDDAPEKNRVADAQLSVYEWDIQQGKEGKLSYEFTTDKDKDEEIKFLPEGVYCIKETKRPLGYQLADTVFFKLESGRIDVIKPDGTPGDNSIVSADASGNPIITVTDQVIKGSLTLEKQYQDSTDTISGLVFTLYDSEGQEMYDCQTDDTGRIVLKDLAEGKYLMKENLGESQKNKTTDNVYIDESAEYKIEVGVKDGTTVYVSWNGADVGADPVIVKNSKLDTSLFLHKFDNTDKAQIGDTLFKLEYRREAADSWEAFGGTDLYSTDSRGSLQIDGLIRGEYRLTETKAHKAYELETEKAFTAYFTVTNQEHGKDIWINSVSARQGLYSMRVENASLLTEQGLGNIRKTGQVTVLKKDGDTLEGLNEVEYTLFKKQESGGWLADIWNYLTGKGYDKAGSIDAEVLDQEGSMTIKGLEWGSYYLTETRTLPGYKLDKTKYEFVIGRDGVDYSFLYENRELYNYKNSFIIQKTDKDGMTKLGGARFTILHDKSKNVIWEGDIDGEVVLEGLLTGGEEYILREQKAPDGYELAEDIRFTISDTGEIFIDGVEEADNIITVRNNPIEITLIKRASSKSAYRLEGARFLMHDVTPGMEGGAPLTVIPDAEGKIMEGLVQGHTYTLEETMAPAGYLLPPKEAVLTFTVSPQGKAIFAPNSFWEGTDTDTVYAFNDPIVVKVIKNSPEGNPLPGCVFRVTGEFAPVPIGSQEQGKHPSSAKGMEAASGKAIEELIVNDDHTDILEGRLLIGNTYTVKEMYAPDGYKVGGEVSFTVKDDGNIRMEASHEYTLNEDGTIVMVDQPYILQIQKTDMEGNGLDGAEFTLNGEFADGSSQKHIRPAKDGLEIAALLSGGKDYILTEITAPGGYEKAAEPVTIQVDYDGSMKIAEGSSTDLAAIEHSERSSILTFKNEEAKKPHQDEDGGQGTDESVAAKPDKGLGIVNTGDNSALPAAFGVLGMGLILLGISFYRKKGKAGK